MRAPVHLSRTSSAPSPAPATSDPIGYMYARRYILEQVVGFGKEDMGALVEGLQRYSKPLSHFFAPFAHRLQSRSLVDEVGSDELHSVRTLASLLAAPLAQRHVRCRCSRERYEAP